MATSFIIHISQYFIQKKHVGQNSVCLANKNKQVSLFNPSQKYDSYQPIIPRLLEKQ